MLIAVLALLAGLLSMGMIAPWLARRPSAVELVYGACLVLGLGLLACGLVALLTGVDARMRLPLGLPWIGARLHIDALAAFFLVLVNGAGALVSGYALGYGAHEPARGRVLPFYPIFLAAMNLVVIADDAFVFLFGWELMSLASAALVVARWREKANLRAGYVYLLMAELGALLLLLAFGLLAGAAGAYDFGAIAAATPPAWIANLVFVLTLAGAGSKAGLMPLHVWLPLAHPAAPSHVSALMSGAMTKVAVYGFIRIVFHLIDPPQVWWSFVTIALGAATAVGGVLYAAIERDLKKILAYSTIENIGVIFIALGLALAFRANLQAAAALAFVAGLMHALNHALFKSLLFMGAGATIAATGAGDVERLGGLIHRMPYTSFFMLGGAMAISALPPLNGFVSEWLIFQAVLISPSLPQWSLKLLAPAAGVMLALSAALSAASFVRLYGVVFLGRPRSSAAAGARETDRPSMIAMGVTLTLCLAAGLFPGVLIDWSSPVAMSVVGARMTPQMSNPWLTIVPILESRSSYNGLLVFAFILVSTVAMVEIIHRFGSRDIRRAPAWDCGYAEEENAATQYSASSFAQPIRRVFGQIAYGARERVDMPAPGDPRPARFRLIVVDLVWTRLYAPIVAAVEATARGVNRTHFWTIGGYLTVAFVALVSLLAMVAIWR